MKKSVFCFTVIMAVLIGGVWGVLAGNSNIPKSILGNMEKAKSWQYSADVTFDGEASKNPLKMKMLCDGTVNFFNAEDPRTETNMKMSAYSTNGGSSTFTINLKSFKDRVYLKLADMTCSNKKDPRCSGNKKNMGKWIKVSKSPAAIAETDEQIRALKNARNWAKEKRLFSDVKQLPDETMDGMDCNTYAVEIKNSIIDKLAPINLHDIVDKISGKRLNTKIVPKGSLIKGQIWVDKDQGFLRKMTCTMDFEDKNTGEQIKANINEVFTGYNDRPVIDEPAQAVDFKTKT